jgi:hypothetical protein
VYACFVSTDVQFAGPAGKRTARIIPGTPVPDPGQGFEQPLRAERIAWTVAKGFAQGEILGGVSENNSGKPVVHSSRSCS